jgi:hypothetical protein
VRFHAQRQQLDAGALGSGPARREATWSKRTASCSAAASTRATATWCSGSSASSISSRTDCATKAAPTRKMDGGQRHGDGQLQVAMYLHGFRR